MLKSLRLAFYIVLALLTMGLADICCASEPDAGVEPPGPAFIPGTRIDADLDGQLNATELVRVIIVLKYQPLPGIAREQQARFLPAIRAGSMAVRSILAGYEGKREFSSPDEMRLQAAAEKAAVTVSDKLRITALNRENNALLGQMRQAVRERAVQAIETVQSEAAAAVAASGGIISYRYWLQNAIAARVPGTSIVALAAHPLVDYVAADERDGMHLDISVPVISAATFWDAGQTGGTYDGAICDTGVDTSHPDLDDYDTAARGWLEHTFHTSAATDPDYNDNAGTTDDLQGHGTHVAGIVMSSHGTYRGVAPGVQVGLNLKAGFRMADGNGSVYAADARAALDWAQAQTQEPEAVNYSAGTIATADDHPYCQFWDAFIESQVCAGVMSAGNDGPAALTVGRPGICYNGICVANIEDQGTLTTADDFIRSSSSRGPTTGSAGDGSDGRRKPDLAAPGTFINSCYNGWETGADFVNKSGTSMSAPHVTGASLLLNDAGILDPREIKALLINTADDRGTAGWDAAWGWGSLNLDRAYLQRGSVFLGTVQESDEAGDFLLYRTTGMDAGETATMTFYRHAVYDGSNEPSTVYTMNHVHLRLYEEADNDLIDLDTIFQDNVHQVVSDRSGSQIIKVYGSDSNMAPDGEETFALAAQEGTALVAPPEMDVTCLDHGAPLGAKFEVVARLQNDGAVKAHNCSVAMILPAGVEIAEGSASQSVGALGPGEYRYAYFYLRMTSPGAKTVTCRGESYSYGETILGSSTFTVTPGAADTAAPNTIAAFGDNAYSRAGLEKIANGSFEDGLAGWAVNGPAAAIATDPHTGSSCLKLGPGEASAYQSASITVPAGLNELLTFWFKADVALFATAGCVIESNTGDTLVYPLSCRSDASVWTSHTVDLSPFSGSTVRVKFYSDLVLGSPSTFWVDDVSVKRGAYVWVTPEALLSLISYDDSAGVDFTEYDWDSGPHTVYTAPFTPAAAEEREYVLEYHSQDNSGNIEPWRVSRVNVDLGPPVPVMALDGRAVFSGGTEKAVNGGFESDLDGWTVDGAVAVETGEVQSGSRSARIGGTGPGGITQQITISPSATRAIVSLWWKCQAGTAGHYMRVGLYQPGGGLSIATAMLANETTEWVHGVWDVTALAGHSFDVSCDVSGSAPGMPVLYVDSLKVREQAATYVPPGATARLTGYDYSEISLYGYSFDGGPWQDGEVFDLVDPGVRSVGYRATDVFGQTSEVSTTVTVDGSGPSGSISINNGALYTLTRDVTLRMLISDPAGITEMRLWNDGSVPGAWEPYASTKAWDLALGDGLKTVRAEFKDTYGNISTTKSASITVVHGVKFETIGKAKTPDLPAGVTFNNLNRVVTGVFSEEGCFYLEEISRSGGIRVECTGFNMPALDLGDQVEVEGVIALNQDAEPVLYATRLLRKAPRSPLRPLVMISRWIGGGGWGSEVPGCELARGLHSTGLLVDVSGKVVWTGMKPYSMKIDDGGGCFSEGLLVDMSAVGPPPLVGSIVSVTGNLSRKAYDKKVMTLLKPDDPADVRVHMFGLP